LICYDAEFPEAARSLAQAGAKILCVPAYTETPFGFNRVRGSIVARCIENQFFAVHSSLVGGFGKEPFVKSYGSSAVLGPLHRPYPPSGVLKETSFEAEELAIEDVDLAQVEKLRTSAETRNYEDRNADVWSL
jgi:predicted amidohydrolase